jgi:hypothetical protein
VICYGIRTQTFLFHELLTNFIKFHILVSEACGLQNYPQFVILDPGYKIGLGWVSISIPKSLIVRFFTLLFKKNL